MFLRFVPEQSIDCHSTRVSVIHSRKSRGGVHKSVSNTLYPILCFVLKWALKEKDRLNPTNVLISLMGQLLHSGWNSLALPIKC